MSKGISLEEFKQQLEGDAVKRCSAQEKTIKELEKIIRDKDEFIQSQTKTVEQLQNRCFVLSRGALCMFCGVKDTCAPLNDARRRG